MESDIPFRFLQVLLLGLGWCIAMSGLFINISMTSVAVTRLVGAAQSTVPVGVHNISSAFSLGVLSYFIIPCLGRRIVYILAGLTGAVGSALMIVGSRFDLYGLLIVGTVLQGPPFAVALTFRFDAAGFFPAPRFSQEYRTRAISLTVGCALLAVGIGIESTRIVRDDLGKDFTGGYTLLCGLYLGQALMTGLVDFKLLEQQQPSQQHQQQQQVKQQDQGSQGPSLREALLRVEYIWPALSGVTFFYTMTAVMSGTPVAMQLEGFTSDDSTFCIEAHAGCMYLPALLVADFVNLIRYIITPSKSTHASHLSEALNASDKQQQQQQESVPIPPTNGTIKPHHAHQQGQGSQVHIQMAGGLREHAQNGHAQGCGKEHEQQSQGQCREEHEQGSGTEGSSGSEECKAKSAEKGQQQQPSCESLAWYQERPPPPPNIAPNLAPLTFTMMLGSAILAVSPGVLLAGTTFPIFMGGLATAGVGWALGYITASSLVTAAFSSGPYLRHLRTAQMVMDLCVLVFLAIANSTAATIIRLGSWRLLLILYMSVLLALFLSNLIYHLYVVTSHRRQQRMALSPPPAANAKPKINK